MLNRREFLLTAAAAVPLVGSTLPKDPTLPLIDRPTFEPLELIERMGWISTGKPDLHVLFGVTGSGITWLTMNIAWANAIKGRTVMIFNDDPIYTDNHQQVLGAGLRFIPPVLGEIRFNEIGHYWLRDAWPNNRESLDFTRLTPKPDLIIWDRPNPAAKDFFQPSADRPTIIYTRMMNRMPRKIDPSAISTLGSNLSLDLMRLSTSVTALSRFDEPHKDEFGLVQVKRRDTDPAIAIGKIDYFFEEGQPERKRVPGPIVQFVATKMQ